MDIILPPKKNVAFDATILSSLMGCGRFTDIRFNHRLVSAHGKSNSLEVGSLIHKVFEVFYKHMINGFPRHVAAGQADAAGRLYVNGCAYCADTLEGKPECGHEPQEYPGVFNTPERSEGFIVGWQFALDTCQQYFEYYKNDSLIPLAAEWVKREIIYEDEEIRVGWKAKFDLTVDTNQVGILSLDHKTFKQRREKSSLSNQFMGHCVLLKSRNVLVNKIGLQTTLPINERLTRELISFSADRLHEWQFDTIPYYAYKYIQFVESGYWPPNYSHCDSNYGTCVYKDVCEADRGMREEVLRNSFRLAPIWDPKTGGEE